MRPHISINQLFSISFTPEYRKTIELNYSFKEKIMKKLFVSLLILLLFFTGCLNFEKEIIIPKSKIQSMIDKKFPYELNVVIATAELNSPKIYFQGSNIGMKLNYSGTFLDNKVNGVIDFNGEILYRPEQGAFFLNNFNIVDISINDSNFKGIDKFKSILVGVVNNYLKNYPVYKLKPKNFKQKLAKLFLKEVKTQGGQLLLLIGT